MHFQRALGSTRTHRDRSLASAVFLLGFSLFFAGGIVAQEVQLPLSLQKVTPADELGIVVDLSPPIAIKGVPYPYNASIIEHEEGYRLFFRSDLGTHRQIGCVELDEGFSANSDSLVYIDTGSFFSEDPRVLQTCDQLFLVYNDFQGHTLRGMYVAELDSLSLQPKYSTRLYTRVPGSRLRSQKNWSPFVGYDEEGTSSLCFECRIGPRIILRLADPEKETLEIYRFYKGQTILDQKLNWPSRWGGDLRGGAPGRPIRKGECLAFFHTTFRENDIDWYVMGAYTFENRAPFRVKAISPEPLVFKGIFEGPSIRDDLRTCYPCGYALGKKQGRKQVYLSCGWNDRAVRIVTLDLDNLLKSLRPIVDGKR